MDKEADNGHLNALILGGLGNTPKDSISQESHCGVKRTREPTAFLADDDDDDEDDDPDTDEHSVSTSSGGRKRTSVKEHSKAQREKRKEYISALEASAQKLSSEINTLRRSAEEACDKMKAIHRTLYNQVLLFLQLFFDSKESILSNSINFQEIDYIWSSVVDNTNGFQVSFPVIPFLFFDSCSLSSNGQRFNCNGIHQLRASTQAWRTMAFSLVRHGRRYCDKLLLSVSMAYDNSSFICDGNTCFACFELKSSNGYLLGKNDIFLKGMLSSKVSPDGDGRKFRNVDIFFNVQDLMFQLSNSFGSNALRRDLYDFFHKEPSIEMLKEDYAFVTSFPSVSMVNSEINLEILGGNKSSSRKITIPRFVSTYLSSFVTLGLPYFQRISFVNESPLICSEMCQIVANLDPSIPLMKGVFLEIFPFHDGEAELSCDMSKKVNNRLLWVINVCEDLSDITLSLRCIEDCLGKVIDRFPNPKCENWKSNDDSKQSSFGESDYVLDSCGKPMNFISKIVFKARKIRSAVREFLYSSPNDHQFFIKLYNHIGTFVKWESIVEKRLFAAREKQFNYFISDVIKGGQTATTSESNVAGNALTSVAERSSVAPESSSLANWEDESMINGQNVELSVDELKSLGDLYSCISTFFAQVRECNLTSKLLLLLQNNGLEDHLLLAEQFIFLAWTKHSSGVVETLLRDSRQLITNKCYENALISLTEAIRLDPLFVEAYNKRATVYFALKRPQECFADIDKVLQLEPFHYGVLCGKALMLLKLKDYVSSLECFERAIAINPSLRYGQSFMANMKMCQDILEKKNIPSRGNQNFPFSNPSFINSPSFVPFVPGSHSPFCDPLSMTMPSIPNFLASDVMSRPNFSGSHNNLPITMNQTGSGITSHHFSSGLSDAFTINSATSSNETMTRMFMSSQNSGAHNAMRTNSILKDYF